jgi:hypothetical protein
VHALIERIAEALAALVPAEPIELRGSWSRATRGDVVDVQWSGVAACGVPIAGIGFLHRAPSLHWAKSAPAAPDLAVGLGLHAHPGARRATFSAGLAGMWLPAPPVSGGPDWTGSCALGDGRAMTGRPYLVARVDGVEFAAVFLPGPLLETGRNRLWRLRDEHAAQLPRDLRELLTRGRSGELA